MPRTAPRCRTDARAGRVRLGFRDQAVGSGGLVQHPRSRLGSRGLLADAGCYFEQVLAGVTQRLEPRLSRLALRLLLQALSGAQRSPPRSAAA